jgi:hypothetical protein
MPQAKPKDRPGADVAPIDRRTAYEPAEVDWTGKIGPYVYRAWRVTDPQISPFVRAVVMKDGKPVRARRHIGPANTSVYHEQPSIRALRLFLLGKVRRRRVPQDNTVDCHPCWKKRLQRRRERREKERGRYDVKTERANGNTRNRLVRN